MTDRILSEDELSEVAGALYMKISPAQSWQLARLFTSHAFLMERVKKLETVVRKEAIHRLDELQEKILHG